MMMLRQLACVKIFVTSFAIASQGQIYESKEALNINSNEQWQSGDCINQKPSSSKIEKDFSQNKPLTCILWCKKKNYPIAGLNNRKCICGIKPEGSDVRKNNGKCGTPCPGLPYSVCGGNTDGNWWNIFSTDDKLGKCVDKSHLQGWLSPTDLNIADIEAHKMYKHRRDCLWRCEQDSAMTALKGGSECHCGNQDSIVVPLFSNPNPNHSETGKLVSGNLENTASNAAGVCHTDCFSFDNVQQVCLITEEQPKDCVNREDLRKLSDHSKGVMPDDRASCNMFCKKKKSNYGAITGRLCFCGNHIPPTANMVFCESKLLVEFFEIEVDCKVDNWAKWGECSVTCGGGNKTRTRDIIQEPEHGGDVCPGLEETIVCNTDKCKDIPTPVLGLSIGLAVVLLLLVVPAVVLSIWKKASSRKREKDEVQADLNPVYATYQVHDDPIAEFTDQNLDYGEVYEGKEMSKTTDVNPDYSDYDSLYA